MIENMTHVMLFVKDYNEALDFYTNKLGFVKVTDVSPAPGWRFLSVAPKGQGAEIILHVPNAAMQGEAEAKRQTELIGKTPSLMFKVDDCKKTCDELRSKGVMITMEPRKAPFGIQALILDLYGNPLWLIEHPM
jgi:catechol 2,3-dioxygenase-like lactoylglutathione lyase family enzyme